MIVNALRGLVKSAGGRLPACSPQGFQERVEASIPLHWPRRRARCCTRSPHSTPASGRWIAASSSWPNGTRRSTLCALFPASTTDRRSLRAHARPPRCGPAQPPGRRVPRPASATKPVRRLGPAASNIENRQRLSAQFAGASAHYVLGRFGPDSELRRWGMKLAASGGKRGKKRAT